jgi:hypothetical protein
MKTFSRLWRYLAYLFLQWDMLKKSCRENQNTHFRLNNFFFENRAVYEIMSIIIVKTEKLQMAKWRRVECWISKATRAQAQARARAPPHTHARINAHVQTHTDMCNTYCFSIATMFSWAHHNVTLYVHCLSFCTAAAFKDGVSNSSNDVKNVNNGLEIIWKEADVG